MSKMLSLTLFALGVFVCVLAYVSHKNAQVVSQHQEAATHYLELANRAEMAAEVSRKEALHWKLLAADSSAKVIKTSREAESKPITITTGSVATAEDIDAIRTLYLADRAKGDHIKIIEQIVFAQNAQIGSLEDALKNMKQERSHLELIIKEEKKNNLVAKAKFGTGGLVVGILIGLLL